MHIVLKRRMYLLSSQLAPLGKGKSPLVWAVISGKTPPKPRVLPAWGGVEQVIDRYITAITTSGGVGGARRARGACAPPLTMTFLALRSA